MICCALRQLQKCPIHSDVMGFGKQCTTGGLDLVRTPHDDLSVAWETICPKIHIPTGKWTLVYDNGVILAVVIPFSCRSRNYAELL